MRPTAEEIAEFRKLISDTMSHMLTEAALTAMANEVADFIGKPKANFEDDDEVYDAGTAAARRMELLDERGIHESSTAGYVASEYSSYVLRTALGSISDMLRGSSFISDAVEKAVKDIAAIHAELPDFETGINLLQSREKLQS